MLGLLYKDFIAVKGKIYIYIMSVLTVLIIISKVLIKDIEYDVLLIGLIIWAALILYCVIFTKLELELLDSDEGRRRKQYYMSMPLSKETYVASKYLFLLITVYVIMSVVMFWIYISLCNSKESIAINTMTSILSALPSITCVYMIIPTIEMPFYIGFGTKKGMLIRTSIFCIIFFIVLVYIMFGDLSIIDKINVVAIIEYLKKHKEVALVLETFIPIVFSILYYVSYRLSLKVFKNKEWEDD